MLIVHITTIGVCFALHLVEVVALVHDNDAGLNSEAVRRAAGLLFPVPGSLCGQHQVGYGAQGVARDVQPLFRDAISPVAQATVPDYSVGRNPVLRPL